MKTSARDAGSVQGERRLVTVLFADVVGSTTLAERMDPEDWTSIMNRAFETMSQAVVRYEGTVGQFIGDEILAYFGAPTSHEDDAERAVRAALDMIAGIQELAAELATAEGIDFRIRVGVNTGMAVVGEVGSQAKREYTAMGDAVNVAARMRAAARPGTILIADPTYRLVTHRFDCVAVGSLEVKGRVDPVAAYEVRGIRLHVGRVRGIPGLDSPMVGRQAELQRLQRVLDVVRAGVGRAAAVIGEPGIGKSRLIGEWRNSAGSEDIRWVHGSCLSYGRGLAYHLLLDLIRSLLGALPDSDEREVRERLAATVQDLLGSRDGDVYAAVAHLLALHLEPSERDRIERLDAHARQSHYVAALRHLLIASAGRRTLVLVCDDVHWADPSSVDLLSRLLPTVQESRILLVLTTRPDRETDGWKLLTAARDRLGEALTEITLSPLSLDDSQRLVANLLAIESLPPWLRQAILQKAEGNPFFVEEVVRMLIDRGAIVRRDDRWVAAGEITALELPDTLRALLRARIDRLPPEAGQALKIASVIGREFPARLLREIVHEPALGTLESWDLIRLATVEPEVVYAFRHALVQDAAYEALLKRERAGLHLKVGEALERLYPDRREDLAGILAYHFENAAAPARATEYLVLAGRHALRRFAMREARAFLDRAAALLPADPAGAEALRRVVEINLMRVEAGYTFVPFNDDLALAEATLPLAQRLGDRALLAETSYLIAKIRYGRGDRPDAPALQEAVQQVLEIGNALGNEKYVGLARGLLGEAAYLSGRYREAIAQYQQALPLLEAREAYAHSAMFAGVMAMAYAITGEFDRAEDAGRHALELGRMSGDPNAMMDAQLFMGRVEAERGNLVQALDLYRRGIALAEETGNTFCATIGHLWLGAHHIRMGQPELGTSAIEKSAEMAQFCNMRPLRGVGRAWLGAVYYERGDVEQAEAAWQAGLKGAEAMGDRLTAAEIRRQRAAALAKGGAWESAAADFEASIAGFEALGARPYLARALHDYGLALQRRGEAAAGEARLRQAARLFDELQLAPH
ncbi:MAG: adenylate/guanylate cyclase domain-containing protein [Armatimonadota bacterium]|nr:adenylate/guanylate cyclase domain-containing protein [Armatimonadota bacterium]